MHPNQSATTRQRVLDHAGSIDAGGFFNLLTAPQLLERVAALVPEHRERAFPPTKTLAMFMTQALSADGSCRQALDDYGVVLDAAIGPCAGKGSDEQTLLRALLDSLLSGEILVADAYYATYFLLCELVRRGVDGVFEQYGARTRSTDFSLGEWLGVRDHLIVLPKPKKPDWMSREDYDQAPGTLTVREFQADHKIMVTTFLCPKDAPKSILKVLYRSRWNVELDLRNIKTTLGMEHLRCRTPDMAVKELWVYLLAYNLIRLLMAQAALLADQIPRQPSFKHTVQVWISWQQRGGGTPDAVVIRALLVLIAGPRVGLRPGRIEPRALKRRLKNYALLTKPRRVAQEEVRKNGHPKKQR